jgi:hypothetical protein
MGLRPPTLDQYSYNYQTPQGGPTLSHDWPRGSQTDYAQTWSNNQINTQTTAIPPRYYPSPRPTPGDNSVGDRQYPTASSSPYYVTQAQTGPTVQPANYPFDIQYMNGRRPSLPQIYSPTPQQPNNYLYPLSPRSSSAYSHPGASPLRLGRHASPPVSSQWSPPHGLSNGGTSNPTPVIHPHNYADSQSPIYSPTVVSAGGSGQAPSPSSLVQLPSSLGETSPDSYSSNGGPSFPVARTPRSAPGKGKKAARDHPYPQSNRKTAKNVSPSNGPPVASTSRVTLDTSPPEAHCTKRKGGTPVSAPIEALRIIVDECIPKAHERDAQRKKKDRGNLREWFKEVARLLTTQPPPKTHLQILAGGKRKPRHAQRDLMLTGHCSY